MPAILSPEYKDAQEACRKAHDPEERKVMCEGELLFLQRSPTAPEEAVRPADRPIEKEVPPGVIACAFCLHAVTTPAARIAVGGAHEHSCVNPHGLRFHFGCFADASCRPAGEPSVYWSWFPGFSWQVEVCPNCGEHLGWLFRSPDSLFHGLILDRLVEASGGR